jgi:hypothetical protein
MIDSVLSSRRDVKLEFYFSKFTTTRRVPQVPVFGTWVLVFSAPSSHSPPQKNKKAGRLCPAYKHSIGCGGQI